MDVQMDVYTPESLGLDPRGCTEACFLRFLEMGAILGLKAKMSRTQMS
jgi:hypothetical protein